MRAATSSEQLVTARLHGSHTKSWPGWADWLAQVPLFSGLSKRQQKQLAQIARLRWFGDGRTVVRAGTPGDAFYAILNGHARLETPDGHVRELGDMDCFGELSLIDGKPRAATVVTVGSISVGRIARSDFLALLREQPAIGVGIAQALVATIRDTQGAAAESPGRGAADDAGHLSAAEGADQVPSLLASLSLFAGLSKRHLRKVARLAAARRYADGAVVVRAGARGDALFVVIEGSARVQVPDGRASHLGVGDYFGELALLDGAPRAATVSADGRLEVLRVPRQEFLKLMREEPGVSLTVVRGLVKLIRGLQVEGAA
ncbi:MAG TPA: cyclic nucleotide-binding domain-containing protein [Thermoleophilia bacterium]